MTIPSRNPRALFAVLAGLCLIAGFAGAASADSAASRQDAGAPQRAAAYATIEGKGSTWSKLIVDKWIGDVDNKGMKVVYSGVGSSAGRKAFADGTVDFGISEIPYQGVDEKSGQADKSDRPYAYLPIVAGGTAFTYQLKVGNDLVRNLRLSGDTLAKIFTNQITNWNDAQISKDNNGRKFPSIPITPVVRSDGSGTTAQFTTWLDKEFPSIWRPYFGKSGLTSYFPKKSGTRTIAQAGSDQVMNTIKGFAGNGTIGYVEYAYPKNAGYPVVKVLNKAGYFVEPTVYNVAVALTKAKIDPGNLTQILDGVYRNTDARSYPLSSYSYMIIPTGATDSRMTTAKRQTLADFLYHSLCTGQGDAGDYGYSPLTLNLVSAGFTQVKKLKTADPKVVLTNRDVKSCNNPTFDGTNPSKNVLAQKAPQPAACDKVGAGPCTTGTGENKPSTDDAGGAPAAGGPADPGAAGAEAAPVVDPETGEAVGSGLPGATGDPTSGEAVYANPLLVSDRAPDSRTFGWLAVIELIALVVLPGLFVSVLRRRRVTGATR
ncbi:MAG: substrate-binding domain-containing protein [Propionibacteriales bacterium]|nr:substrate-binding domain-containing protein [Propionibacteriales bacterium]